VDDPQPATAPAGSGARRELILRIASAVILAPLAVAIAWLGGWIFFAFWTLAAIGILWEWRRVVAGRGGSGGLGECVVAFAGIAAMVGFGGAAALILLFGAVVECLAARTGRPRLWIAGGIV